MRLTVKHKELRVALNRVPLISLLYAGLCYLVSNPSNYKIMTRPEETECPRPDSLYRFTSLSQMAVWSQRNKVQCVYLDI